MNLLCVVQMRAPANQNVILMEAVAAAPAALTLMSLMLSLRSRERNLILTASMRSYGTMTLDRCASPFC